MIIFPNAKINLGLNVVEKRPDGYHNIETVFYPVPLTDCVEIQESETMKFTSSGIMVDCSSSDNLCVKAYEVLRKDVPTLPNVHIHLDKQIPFGAGLGGGSADASFVLKLANNMFKLGKTDGELAEIAITIGADCPFFIYNQPQYATGLGNEFSDAFVDLSGYWIVLVQPSVSVNTALAYKHVTPKPSSVSIPEILGRPVKEWKDLLVNDFEASVFTEKPEIREVKDQLYSLGADYTCMSGSGSSVFGLFDSEPKGIKQQFEDKFVFVARL